MMLYVSGLANAAPILESTGVEPSSFRSMALLKVASADPLDGVASAQRVKLLSAADGLVDGMLAAVKSNTGTVEVIGFFSGAFTGLLGISVGYLLMPPANIHKDEAAFDAMLGPGKGDEYRKGFRLGWEDKTRANKRAGYLGAGILGTVAWVLFASDTALGKALVSSLF